jgi:hypothetical protein
MRVLPTGFDVVFDGIGEEGYRRSFAALRRGGLLCLRLLGGRAGAASDAHHVDVDCAPISWRSLPGGKRARFYSVNVMRARHHLVSGGPGAADAVVQLKISANVAGPCRFRFRRERVFCDAEARANRDRMAPALHPDESAGLRVSEVGASRRGEVGRPSRCGAKARFGTEGTQRVLAAILLP